MNHVRHPHPGTAFHVLLNGDIKPSQIYMKFSALQLSVAQTPSGEITQLNEPLPLTTFASIPSLNPLHRFLKSGDILYAVNALSTMGWPYSYVVDTLLEKSMPIPLILSFFRPGKSNATESLVQLVLHPYLNSMPKGRIIHYYRNNLTDVCEESRDGIGDRQLIEMESIWKGSAEWRNRHNQFASAVAAFSAASKQRHEDVTTIDGSDDENRIINLDSDVDAEEEDEEVQRLENEISDANFGEITDIPLYSDYVPQKLRIEGAARHPGDVVTSSSLEAVEAPDTSAYVMMLPPKCIRQHKISLLQLESVSLAGLAHSRMLPKNGTRTGFFLGDGAGVGKGRQVAAIIYDNMVQGRSKAIWISVSNDLFMDARRDLDDLGAAHIPLASLSKMT